MQRAKHGIFPHHRVQELRGRIGGRGALRADDDGCRGLRHVKRRGGVTLVQDLSTAVRRDMPYAAVATPFDKVLAPDQISTLLDEPGRAR